VARSRCVSRIACAILLSLMLVVPSHAQQANVKPELLITLSVTPAAAPQPALKYLLLPELRELNPGNPIQGYFKCYLAHYRFVFDHEEFDRSKTLLAMPLDDLPPAPNPGEISQFALAKVDAAARLDHPDWQILLKLRADGFETLLPDVQAMRALSRALAARFRAEIAGGRIDDAIRTAKTMFAMARHMGEHPTYIGNLVGIAIAATAINPLEELLEQPDCPNLYWALANLPSPFFSLRNATEGERLTIWGFTRDLDSTRPMSAEKIKKFLEYVGQMTGNGDPKQSAARAAAYVADRSKNAQKLAAARTRLVESGVPEERLKTFPPEQVILLDEERMLRIRFDEFAKIMLFPFWQCDALIEKPMDAKAGPTLLADPFLPAQRAVRKACARIDQRFGLLRAVEALRLYAAAHHGELPAKLADISVPLADDPVSGKPFRYELVGKTAHLRGATPSDAENDKFFRVHYEINMKN
jgi:hypothetical protein